MVLFLLVVVLGLVAIVAIAFVRFDRVPAQLEAKYAGPPSRFVEAGGIRFHIRDRGTGPALVLLHGQSANFMVWEPAAERLARHRRVISVDMPGHGLTGPDPVARYGVAQMADSLDALVVALGLERFALAGNSLGGGVSEEYALAHPDRLTALLLLDPIGPPIVASWLSRLLAVLIFGTGAVFHGFTPRWMIRIILSTAFGDRSRMTAADVDSIYELLLRAGNRDAQRQTIAGALDPTLPGRIGGITPPTLLIWGSRDSWISPRHADWFAALLNGLTVQIFEGIGHQPMLEDAAATVAAMESFLDAHGG
ncbi:MAG: alpha/beta fold hydrolase [Devosia sp.]